MTKITCVSCFLMVLFPIPSTSSNSLVEQHWSEVIMSSSAATEIKWLKTQDQKFIALYQAANTKRPFGGVILLHDRGNHPDWPEVIAPLRQTLPDFGWSTLSIQLPVLSSSAILSDYVAIVSEAHDRISVAVDYFYSLGVYNVALLGHGFGAVTGLDYLEKSKSAKNIKAFVAVGILSFNPPDVFDTLTILKKIKLPLLDIYGSQDLPSVTRDASERKKNVRINKLNRQIEIAGSDHFFTGQNEDLIVRIKSWLKIATPGVELDINSIELSNN